MKNKDTRTYSEVSLLHKHLEKILHFSGDSPNIDFLISSLVDESHMCAMDELLQWLDDMNHEEYFQVVQIPLTEMRKWNIDPVTGDICHESGGFFSIRGLSVKTNYGPVAEWAQPIIDQPEIGVLGILTKKFNGVLHFLMQAKAEPGNINTFQLSPTVQATRSNFTRLHGGKSIKYLEYFLEKGKSKILVDQLQSEQGARFYKKRNRNIIVRVSDNVEIDVSTNHRWVTLGQLKRLLQYDDVVNMDTRSVISCISFIPDKLTSLKLVSLNDLYECIISTRLVTNALSKLGAKMTISAHYNTPTLHSTDSLLHRVTKLKFNTSLEARMIPLKNIEGWKLTADEISHEERKYFSVIGVRIKAAGREVQSWDQPIIKQVDPGIVGYLISEIDSVIHFLVQLKTESGSMDILEFAPTVQCITGSYQTDSRPMFVNEFLSADSQYLIHDSRQSEEGGRFYQESNRNMIMFKEYPLDNVNSGRYLWMTLKQLKNFIRYNNYVNVESRSLLAII